MKRILFILGWLLFSGCHAECVVYQHEHPLAMKNQDAVFELLSLNHECPSNIQSFGKLISSQSLKLQTAMVANRGKNNPGMGSFSFFSSIHGQLTNGFSIKKGEFFLGFFTKLKGNSIQLSQEPFKNNLLIELIAWDKEKRWYNFYELRGVDGKRARWFYRGNSQDAYLDNQLLYRQENPDKPTFGNRMRCSACHNAGGPIMKEIKAPHNDWWQSKKRLVFSPNYPDHEVQELIGTLVESDTFSQLVMRGAGRIDNSLSMNRFKATLSLQEQLRPLFCTQEINLESDTQSADSTEVHIPSGFWINPLLGHVELSIPREQYRFLLFANRMRFPETKLYDADNAWLTPVKGRNDIIAIKKLIADHVISARFSQAVLLIDFKHPVFSSKRCGLMKLLPNIQSPDWQKQFLKQLKTSQQPEAHKLLKYLSAPPSVLNKIIDNYQQLLQHQAKEPAFQQRAFKHLIELRASVYKEELSKNPLGQILEPGFRVIFPVPGVSQDGAA
ncbi:hypothetical protein E3226_001710 [Legionella geestiana]|nr:hypothetical protein E3226_001710 [Legionella geestiana]